MTFARPQEAIIFSNEISTHFGLVNPTSASNVFIYISVNLFTFQHIGKKTKMKKKCQETAVKVNKPSA